MNKQIKWPLILIFAAFSFFSNLTFAALDEMPIKPWVEPKVDGSKFAYDCRATGGTLLQPQITLEACQTFLFERLSYPTTPCDTVSCRWYKMTNPHLKVGSCVNGLPNCIFQFDLTSYTVVSGGRVSEYLQRDQDMGYANNNKPITVKTCPPTPDSPYTVGPVPESDQNPTHEVCKMKFTPCPLGYYANAVSTMPGQAAQCVPIQCPAKGQQSTSIKNLKGIIPLGGSGTYCDGLCNYSIEAGSIAYAGQQFATGVSLGSQCGQSPVDGQKFTPLDKEKNCTEYTLSGTGASFLECLEGTDEPAPDPNNPDLNLDAKKVDPQPTIDPFTGIECTTVEDKMSCVGKNVTDAITKQTKDEAKLAAERHNKLLEAQKEITDYVERQQRNREEARKNDAVTMVEAIQEVNRTLQTGGGGGGTGTIVGLEGLVSAVEGIGEGVNETSVETDLEPSEGIESFYEAEYPNGFQDVWQKNKAAFENTEMNQYLDSWRLTAQGSPPPMQLCFNIMVDFGCSEFVIDPRVFPFLRIIMLVSTAFLCRALIFGG